MRPYHANASSGRAADCAPAERDDEVWAVAGGTGLGRRTFQDGVDR
jgi:hypothetical protein